MNTKIDSLVQMVNKAVCKSDQLMEQLAELEDAAVKPAREVRSDDLAQISLLEHTMICGRIEKSRSRWRLTAVVLGAITVALSGGLFCVLFLC